MNLQASGNPETGAITAKYGKMSGDDTNNVGAGVFESTNGLNKPVTTGAYGEVNLNGHGMSVEHGHMKGFGSSTTVSGRANLFDNKLDSVNATAFHTRMPTHDQFGGGLNMKTATGHSAALGVAHVPQFNMTTATASGQVNLMSRNNMNIDAMANASRHMSGPFRGKSDFGGGLNMNYRF